MRSLRSEDRQKQVQGLGYKFLNIKSWGVYEEAVKKWEKNEIREMHKSIESLNPLHVDLICLSLIMQISSLSLSFGRHLPTLLPLFWDVKCE